MRKQVQKERCTKIMLTKCKVVCYLYDKVQLAAAKMLDAEPAIFQFECNVPTAMNENYCTRHRQQSQNVCSRIIGFGIIVCVSVGAPVVVKLAQKMLVA